MTAPTSKFRWLTHVTVPVAILSACGMAFYALGSRPQPPRKSKPEVQTTSVETVAVRRLHEPLVIQVSGEVVPVREVKLSTEVGGRIVHQNPKLKVGEFIGKDELLIQIDRRRFQLEVARLKTVRKQAVADIEKLELDKTNLATLVKLSRESLILQQQETERVQRLRERDVLTETDVATARQTELSTRQSLEQLLIRQREFENQRRRLELAHELAEIQLQLAELDEQCATIRSPAAGIVIAAPVEQHSTLEAGDAVAVIEETVQAEVHCHLKMEELSWVWEHDDDRSEALATTSDSEHRQPAIPSIERRRRLPPVTAKVVYRLAGREYSWDGFLVRQHGSGLDPNTRTVPCRVVVHQTERKTAADGGPPVLMRGMFVNVRIQCRPRRPLLEIPERGVRADRSVWLARNGQLRIVQVRLLRIQDGVAIVDGAISEISTSDRVITSPIPNVRDGLPIRESQVSAGDRPVADRRRTATGEEFSL